MLQKQMVANWTFQVWTKGVGLEYIKYVRHLTEKLNTMGLSEFWSAMHGCFTILISDFFHV